MNSRVISLAMITRLVPLLLLVFSNAFMTYAWYGHLKHAAHRPLWYAIFLSWGIAFFEYCLQVPANRWGFEVYSLGELKVMQEVISLSVFSLFAWTFMGEKPSWNYFYAALCLAGAVFFIFRART